MDSQSEEKEIPLPTEINGNFASKYVLVQSSAFEPRALLVCSSVCAMGLRDL